MSHCWALGDALGGFGEFGLNLTLERTFDMLPPHGAVRVTMDVFAFDNWEDDDTYTVFVGDEAFGPFTQDGTVRSDRVDHNSFRFPFFPNEPKKR